VTDAGRVTVKRHGQIEADLNPLWLADHCPTYAPALETPEYHRSAHDFDPASLPSPQCAEALLRLLGSADIASKRYVWQQFDQHVQTQTVVLPGTGDAAVLALRGTKRGIAVKLDGNARQVYLDPFIGGQLVVAEAARNVACVGAVPRAVTDGLNFGNPQRPHVFWQFKNAVEGIALAAEALGTPVISGNVSFYNESDLGEVLPTPMIGMLGVLENVDARVSMTPRADSAEVWLLHTTLEAVRQRGMGASAFSFEYSGRDEGLPVAPNLAAERLLCELLARLASEGLLEWAHDSSEGGLAVAAAEVAIVGQVGMDLAFVGSAFEFAERNLEALFGELPGRVLVGVTSNHSHRLAELAHEAGIHAQGLGAYSDTNGDFLIRKAGVTAVSVPIMELARAYENATPMAFEIARK
jgi:phosphoribosylformylglycinamidine synthase